MEELNLESLINQAKTATKTPIQSVQPVNINKVNKTNPEEELQIAFYLPKTLYKKVKLFALEQDVTIKTILNQSIEKYIKDIS